MKRTLILLLVAFLSFGAGMYVGYRWLAKPHLWIGAVGEAFMADQHAMLQYREGSYQEAEQALSSYVEFLNKLKPTSDTWKPGESPWLNERGIRSDKILAWSRLALLHERHNNTPAAEAAWRNAESVARAAKFRDPSAENLRELILRLDQPRREPLTRGLPNSTQQLSRPGAGPAAELP